MNVLAAGQGDVARLFATKCSGDEKFAGVEHEDAAGVPVLSGALAWVACELDSELSGGDHVIATGRPVESGGNPEASPPVFFRGRYHTPAL